MLPVATGIVLKAAQDHTRLLQPLLEILPPRLGSREGVADLHRIDAQGITNLREGELKPSLSEGVEFHPPMRSGLVR